MSEQTQEKQNEKRPAAPPELLTPQAQAFISESINSTVKEMLIAMMPVLQSIALTPEKIAEAERIRRLPTEEQQAAIDREKRERLMQREEAEQNEANKRLLQENCPHRYVTGQLSCSPISNHPDGQKRFCCHLCHTIFTPREWRIGPPTLDGKNPRGTPFIAEPHPQYKEIATLMMARMNG